MKEYILAPILAWFFAQVLKSFYFYSKNKVYHWRYLLSDGGMPSAHAATMTALTTSIWFNEGASSVFILALFVTLIILRDASGVRLESSKQATILNELIAKTHLKEKKLKEYIGHTKRQVATGALLGIFVAILIAPLL
ncbi:MAG: divergent PAP2 family protein [Candidatus Woesearchaeota archaeon]